MSTSKPQGRASTLAPGPLVTLNRLVAVAMVHGPRPALRELDLDGDLAAARACYRRAAKRTLSLPERRYLEARAAGAGAGKQLAARGDDER